MIYDTQPQADLEDLLTQIEKEKDELRKRRDGRSNQ